MCGIVGLYGDTTHINSKDKKEFLLQALVVDSLRGNDSTGLACLPRKAGVFPQIQKRALSGPDFVQTKGAIRLVEKMPDSTGYIGHNRSKTRGDVEDDTAHPFQYKHITLVHNGTVYNSDKLIKGKCEADNPVDSAQVAWAFSVCEADEVLPIMSGPFSLVWWDSRDATLHFARNEEKPMYWGVDLVGKMMYYASELRMLNWLLERNNIKIKPQCKFTAPGQHYIFKNPGNVEDYTIRPFLKAASKNPKAGGSGNWKRNLDGKNPTSDHQPQRGGPVSTIPASKVIGQTSGNPQPSSSETTQTTTQTTQAAHTPTSTNTTNTGTTQTTGNTDEHAEVVLLLPNKEAPKSVLPDSALFTKDGKKHPAEAERLKRGVVGTILSGVRDNKRMKMTQSLAEKANIEPFKNILAKPRLWVPYHEEVGIGCMFLRKGDVNIQCFNISMALWTKCARSTLPSIPLKIISYRLNYEEDTVFIGEINADQVDRLIIANKARSKSTYEDEGDEEELVELATEPVSYTTRKEFKKLIESGCYKCMRKILENEASTMGFAGPDQDWPICTTCWNQPVVRAEFESLADSVDKRVH
jgi:hypothetical protein